MRLTKILSVAAVAVLGLVSTVASAENDGHFYAGAYHFDWKLKGSVDPALEEEADIVVSSVSASGGRLVAGYMLNDYVGFEVHAADGGTDKLFDGEAEAELDKLYGVFARFNMPLYRNWGNIFALVGGAKGEVTFSADVIDFQDTIDESSLSLGVGVEVAILPERLYLSADYMQYLKDTNNSGLENLEFTATSIGLRYLF